MFLHPVLIPSITRFALAALLIAAPAAGAFAQKKVKPAPEPPSATKTYPEDQTDPLPAFTGGPEALRKFLADHVIVPPFALNNELAGVVDIEFVLDQQGQMDSVRVSNGVGCGLDEEALRVARLTAGKWTPGQIQDVAVRTRVDLPITFRVANKNSRAAAFVAEMRVKYAAYQSTGEYQKDQQTYQAQVVKQTP
jgi:periplasmic protein TonB